MPRPKKKSRIEHLADALDAAHKAGVSLEAIDLRTCTRDLRELIKGARAKQQQLRDTVVEAMKTDVPDAPPT